jgi:hypothetical protein
MLRVFPTGRLALTLAAFLLPVVSAACGGDDESGNPRLTLDEVGCRYEGDETPKAPTFMVDVDRQVSSFSYFEVDRIPADVTNDEVEAFFEEAQGLLEEGEAFLGLPKGWRLINRGGFGTSTGSMRIGDPVFPDQKLTPGQRYLVWCSTGEPPIAVFFATVLEPT